MDEWDVVRFVRLYARCRSSDEAEQSRIERQLLTQRIPFPFQEMVDTIRTYRENPSGQVDRIAVTQPHQRNLIARLRIHLNDMQVLRVLKELGVEVTETTPRSTPQGS